MKATSIYIVEDELLITASLKTQLENFGYKVLGTATKCDVCLQEISRLRDQGTEPEIVLMDIHIRGDIDGIETARIITEKFNCGIIFITGQSSKEVYARSFSIKPFGYLLKPIDHEQTKMTIEIAAYQRKLEIENKRYQNDLVHLLEEQTRAKEEALSMYQALVDNSLMGFVVVQNGRFVFANKQAAGIFGYTREEFLALSQEEIFRMMHPEDFQKMMQYPEKHTDTEIHKGVRMRIIRKDGSQSMIVSFIRPILYQNRPAVHKSFFDYSLFEE